MPNDVPARSAAPARLIGDTRAAADNDTARQSELLEQRVRKLPARRIADFRRDPDSLAPIVQDADQGDWEDAYGVADESDLSGDPRGNAWDDENQEALIQRYPRLAARFR